MELPDAPPYGGAMDLHTTWRTHRPLKDVALLFIPMPAREKPAQPTAPPMENLNAAFYILESTYLLQRSMEWFSSMLTTTWTLSQRGSHVNKQRVFAGDVTEAAWYGNAMASCPEHLPVLVMCLPLQHARGIDNEHGYCEHAIRTFFSLARALSSRVGSDDNIVFSDAARRHAEEQVQEQRALFTAAREHLLDMHALATYFQCSRVLRWIESNLIDTLHDEMALVLLDYMLEWDAKTEEFHINDPCVTLYTLTIMWYRCLRQPSPSPTMLDHRIAQLTRQCPRHAAIDVFYPAMRRLNDSAIELRGAFTKCLACYDSDITQDPANLGSTLVHADLAAHAAGMPAELGYWALHLHEERSATGKRHFTVRHVGARAAQAFTEHGSCVAPQSSARAGIEAEVFASTQHQSSVSSTGPDAFSCCLSLQLVRRERRVMRISEPSLFVAKEFGMAATSDGVAKYLVHMPPHWRLDDYPVGYCRGCRSMTNVAVLVYSLAITRTPACVTYDMDAPMPDAAPLFVDALSA